MSRMKSVTTLALVLGLAVASMAYGQGSTSGSTETKPAAPATHAKSATKVAAVAKCDINSASKEELMKVSGIDDATADKIIAGRPFKTKGALVAKGIVSKEAYAKLSAHIIAKKAAAATTAK
jgi:DNA uptake protein ComE-like DNA-binding protein